MLTGWHAIHVTRGFICELILILICINVYNTQALQFVLSTVDDNYFPFSFLEFALV